MYHNSVKVKPILIQFQKFLSFSKNKKHSKNSLTLAKLYTHKENEIFKILFTQGQNFGTIFHCDILQKFSTDLQSRPWGT